MSVRSVVLRSEGVSPRRAGEDAARKSRVSA